MFFVIVFLVIATLIGCFVIIGLDGDVNYDDSSDIWDDDDYYWSDE